MKAEERLGETQEGKAQGDTKDVIFTCRTFWKHSQYESSVSVTTLGHEGFKSSWLGMQDSNSILSESYSSPALATRNELCAVLSWHHTYRDTSRLSNMESHAELPLEERFLNFPPGLRAFPRFSAGVRSRVRPHDPLQIKIMSVFSRRSIVVLVLLRRKLC